MVGPVGVTLLQSIDPSAALGLPNLVRGPLVFVMVLLVGAAILWRWEGFVDRSIEASVDRPLASLGYGLATHAVIGFAALYLVTRLSGVVLSGRSLAPIGLVFGVAAIGVTAAVGFTVVGGAIVELFSGRRRWFGLLLGAVVASLTAIAEPTLGGIVWFVIVSIGVGGPARRWLHTAEGEVSR